MMFKESIQTQYKILINSNLKTIVLLKQHLRHLFPKLVQLNNIIIHNKIY